MKPDDLAKALALLAREQEAARPRIGAWPSSAQGSGLLLGDGSAEIDEEAEVEALRPLDESARERIVARIFETMAHEGTPAVATKLSLVTSDTRPSSAPLATELSLVTSDTRPSSAPVAMKLSLDTVDEAPPLGAVDAKPSLTARDAKLSLGPAAQERSRARVISFVAAPLLAAAAIALVVRTSSVGPIPAYELAFQGGERATRSAPEHATTEIPRLGPRSSVDFVIRPAHLAEGEVALSAFLLRGGVATPIDVHAEASHGGAFRVRGERERVFPGVSAGPVEIIFAVGRPAAVPHDGAALLRELSSGHTSSVRLVRRELVFTDT